MKKRFSHSFAILSLLLISTAVISSCSSDPSKSIVFKAEKLYHKAEKMRQTAIIKPELSGPRALVNIKAAYSEVTGYCWENIDFLPAEKYTEARKGLESVAFLATNRLSQIYYSERKFDSATFIIRQLLNFTNLEGLQLVSARLNLARAFLAQGSLSEAINVYHLLIDSFYPPVDNENEIVTGVLNLPLEIVGIYRSVEEDSAAASESSAAEEYYQRLISDWPNSALETAARSNLANLYFQQERWDETIENLSLLKDSTGQTDVEAAMMIAGVTLDGKKDYDEAIRLYDNLLARVTDTMVVPAIHLRKGIAFFEKKDYDLCRNEMSLINKDFPYFFRNNPTPQKYIALSFEKIGNWNRAENEFKWLIDNYSATEEAFDAHLTIADHYKKQGNKELTDTWFRKAEEFYYAMANRYAGSNIEASAISYLAEASRRQEKWDQAAKYLENLYERFPTTEVGRRAIINAASIYRDRLGNPARADSLISQLRSELFTSQSGKNIDVTTDDNK